MNKYTASSLPQNEYWELITSTLSSYEVKEILSDGKIKTYKVEDDYFLINDVWNIDNVGQIPNFAQQYKEYKYRRKNIVFSSANPMVSLEFKFVFYHKLFTDIVSLSSLFNSVYSKFNRLNEYLSERHPKLSSLLELDIDKEEKLWIWWLTNKGIATTQKTKIAAYGEYENKAPIAIFLRTIYDYLSKQTDTREEWKKDKWDVRVLNKKYGIKYSRSKTNYYLDFKKIQNEEFRRLFKEYIKIRLLGARNFSWATAYDYLYNIPGFLNFISKLEPDWNDLNHLTREHFEKYLEYVNHYAKNNIKQKNANPTRYIFHNIIYIKKFLEDSQRYESSIAPKNL